MGTNTVRQRVVLTAVVEFFSDCFPFSVNSKARSAAEGVRVGAERRDQVVNSLS